MIKHRLLVAVFACMAMAGWSQDQEIIVESYSDGLNNKGFSAVQGNWAESTGKSTAAGVTATKAVYNDANAEAAVARFTPEIPATGKYEVFITYPVQGNATDVKYSVVSADGTKEIVLTQNGRDLGHKPLADSWYSLGIFNFNNGTSGYVEISDPLTGEKPLPNEPNARIYADAVKFVPSTGTVTASSAGAQPAAATPAPAAAPAGELPSLPAPADASVADMPGLPAIQAAATPETVAALPGLPATTTPSAGPVAQLPALPATSTSAAPATGELPTLPAATPALASAAMPSLPATTPGPVEALPALPASDSSTAQTGLPALPSTPAPAPPAQGTAVTTQTTIVTAQATPYPVPDLPSLAPVTPTPERTLPSPADTPVAGMPAGLPGGPLSTLPPTPAMSLAPPSATPDFSTAQALPGAMATPASTATPAPFGINSSSTQYNPSNLQWMFDFGAALNTARAQNKNVMVFFTAAGNKAANTYETSYFADPSVRPALDRYVLIKVDFPKNTRLGYSLGIFGAGIIVVTTPAGDVTARITQLPPTPLDLVKQMAGEQPVQAVPAAGATPGAMAPAAGISTTDTVAGQTPATGAPELPPMPGAAGAPALPPLPGAPEGTPATGTPASGLPALPSLPALPGAP